MTKTTTTPAIAYLRVSTEDQHLGPEAQRRDIEAWATRTNHDVVVWHEDHGVSGTAPVDKRPALLDALEDVVAGSTLVVAKRDRLSRSVLNAAIIESIVKGKDASIESADGAGNGEGPEAAFFSTIFYALGELEAARTAGRTRAALAVKKARGERVGTIPFGFRLGEDGANLVKDVKEQASLARMKELRAEGLSLASVAKNLASEGHLNRKGKPFSKSTLSRLAA